jgi:hypothetical protein
MLCPEDKSNQSNYFNWTSNQLELTTLSFSRSLEQLWKVLKKFPLLWNEPMQMFCKPSLIDKTKTKSHQSQQKSKSVFQ